MPLRDSIGDSSIPNVCCNFLGVTIKLSKGFPGVYRFGALRGFGASDFLLVALEDQNVSEVRDYRSPANENK